MTLIRDSDGRPRQGAFFPLEDKATAILVADRAGVTQYSQLNYWFTDEQWLTRHRHEVLVAGGPDRRLYQGIFSRAYSSRDHRPGFRYRFTTWMDPWRQFWFESADRVPPTFSFSPYL